MAILEAENKLATMRAELRERFLYGDLERLGGMDALRRFYQLQRDIKAKRLQAIEDQQRRRKEMLETVVTGGLIVMGATAVILILWMAIELISMGGK